MGNGSNEYVDWPTFRSHESEDREAHERIASIEANIGHIHGWKEGIELDLKDSIRKSDERHLDNLDAMNKIGDRISRSDTKQAKMWGIGFGIVGTLQIALIIIGLVIAFNK
jgi:hypothetical protein